MAGQRRRWNECEGGDKEKGLVGGEEKRSWWKGRRKQKRGNQGVKGASKVGR